MPSAGSVSLVFFVPPITVMGVVDADIPVGARRGTVGPLSNYVPPDSAEVCTTSTRATTEDTGGVPIPSEFGVAIPTVVDTVTV